MSFHMAPVSWVITGSGIGLLPNKQTNSVKLELKYNNSFIKKMYLEMSQIVGHFVQALICWIEIH